MKGNVKFFDNTHGWGIIKGEDGASYFIHHTDITDEKFFPEQGPEKYRTLKDEEKVTFDIDKVVDKPHDAARNLVIVQ